ncbi:hypothetical protein D3C80_1236540 [compost metagenome]
MQALLQRLCKRGLARPRQAGQPDHAPAMAVQQFMRLARNGCWALMDVSRLAGRAEHHAGGNSHARGPVDQDQSPLGGVVVEGVHGDRRWQGQPSISQPVGGQNRRCVGQRQARGHGPCAQLDLIAARRIKRLIPHPQQSNIQPIRSGGPIIRRREHVATRHVHVLSQLKGDGVAGPRPRHFDVA